MKNQRIQDSNAAKVVMNMKVATSRCAMPGTILNIELWTVAVRSLCLAVSLFEEGARSSKISRGMSPKE